MLVTGLSPVGRRLAHGLPVAALVAFQAFRLPLELVLHCWAEEGVLPIQMTYAGHNFDIVTGVSAVVVALWLWRVGPSPRVVAAFNLLGLGLLVVLTPRRHLSSVWTWVGHFIVVAAARVGVPGWQRERLAAVPDAAAIELSPDWACEVLSPSTTLVDRKLKLPIYARESAPRLAGRSKRSERRSAQVGRGELSLGHHQGRRRRGATSESIPSSDFRPPRPLDAPRPR